MTQIQRERPDDYFADWKEREALAEAMIPLVGTLYRQKNVKSYIYGHSLHNESVLDIMQAHRFVRQIEQNELSEFETYPVLKTLSEMDLGPAHIDVGRMAIAYEEAKKASNISLENYLKAELKDLIGRKEKNHQPRDVVLYGFGRIGRLLARLLVEKAGGGDNLRLRAIVVRQGGAKDDLAKRVGLLQRDSVHGAFRGTIRIDQERQSFIANGVEVKVIYASKPEDVDYINVIKDKNATDKYGEKGKNGVVEVFLKKKK